MIHVAEGLRHLPALNDLAFFADGDKPEIRGAVAQVDELRCFPENQPIILIAHDRIGGYLGCLRAEQCAARTATRHIGDDGRGNDEKAADLE
ncbi:hypothetical protein D3C86_1027270 [compost metagenome]